MQQLNLPARAFHQFLKLACAIADLAEGEETKPHLRQRCPKRIIEWIVNQMKTKKRLARK